MSNLIRKRLDVLKIRWSPATPLSLLHTGKMKWRFSFADASREEIQGKLRKLLAEYSRISITWLGYAAAAELMVEDFIHHYDDLWLPGADDILIADESGNVLALLDHEEDLRSPEPTAAERAKESGGGRVDGSR